MEGRWRPTINVDKQEDGRYKAWYEDQDGKIIEYVDELSTFAINQVQGMLKEGVANGRITPR